MRPGRGALPAALLALAAGAVPAGPAAAGDPPLDPEPLQAAREAARWVARQARPRDPGKAATFPEYAETPEEVPGAPLYAGTAGVLVFLENAAALLEDDGLRRLADRAAAGLVTSVRSDGKGGATWAAKPGEAGSAGLYVGDAGVAWALLVRHRVRKDAGALRGARRAADGLLSRMQGEGDAAAWDGNHDVIGGAAGTLLVLLEVAADTGERKYAEAAARAGRWLARRGETEEAGPGGGERRLWWRPSGGFPRHYPNFSHGTAGVAYALARVAAATGDRECREAAVAGARWLLAHATRDGGTLRWHHYSPGHEDTYREGWCHGPTGTGRLFLLLHSLTGEEEWMAAAREAAAWLLREKPDPGREESSVRFYSPSLCCGAAGVIDFYVDMYRATGDRRYREFARGTGRHLVRLSKADGDGRKWTNYDRPDEKGIVYHGVSLLLGASGEGLALLRLAAADRPLDPVVGLPDRAVAAGGRGGGGPAPPSPAPGPPEGGHEGPPPAGEAGGGAAAPAAPAPGAPELVSRCDTPREGHDGGAYVVLTSRGRAGDPFHEAARRLAEWRKGVLVADFDPADPGKSAARLKAEGARRVALVLPPEEVDVNLQRRMLAMAARLDDDPFADLSFGFVTGTRRTPPLEMVRRARALEKAGLPRRWTGVSVASGIAGFVSPGAGDPTAKRAGWEGSHVYWGCRESDPDALASARRTLKGIGGPGVVTFSGCGDPEGTWLFSDRRNLDAGKHWKFDPAKVGQDPKGEMPRVTAEAFRSMDLGGAVVLDGVCHSGSPLRVFVEGDIVSTFGTVEGCTEYRIPEGRSVCGAVLDAGAAAFVAPMGPNHGYATLVEAQRALEGRLDLGDLVRSTWNDVALSLGEAPSPDLYLPGGPPVDRGNAMAGGGMNRALFGDPALAPFAREEVAPAVRVERREVSGAGSGFAVAATVREKDWAQWDLYGGGGVRDRIGAVLPLAPEDPASLEVRVSAADPAGKAIAVDRLSCAIERIDGKRLLHLQAAAPRGLGLGEVGSSAVFTVVPATGR